VYNPCIVAGSWSRSWTGLGGYTYKRGVGGVQYRVGRHTRRDTHPGRSILGINQAKTHPGRLLLGINQAKTTQEGSLLGIKQAKTPMGDPLLGIKTGLNLLLGTSFWV